MWGNEGIECAHDAPADDPVLLGLAALVFLAWAFFAPAAIDAELANEEAQARRHRDRVERLAPGAIVDSSMRAAH